MSVYRLHSSSLIHDKQRMKENMIRKPDHYKFIWDNFGTLIDKKDYNYVISNAYFSVFKLKKGLSVYAWQALFLSIIHNPFVLFHRAKNFLRH